MTKGIRVIWPHRGEIEYFYGIDIHNLDGIPEFHVVESFWPYYPPEPRVWYNISAWCERHSEREIHLLVTYDEADNRELSKRYPSEIDWGTNRIVLKQGKQKGQCQWQPLDPEKPGRALWEAFDLEINSAKRELKDYVGSKKQAHFRAMILNLDRCCVLSKEKTREALEAAHLVPARKGENDIPANGIALRADLHRLFDARLFTFRENGSTKITDPGNRLSLEYRKLLQSRRLPKAVLERVRGILAFEQFQNR